MEAFLILVLVLIDYKWFALCWKEQEWNGPEWNNYNKTIPDVDSNSKWNETRTRSGIDLVCTDSRANPNCSECTCHKVPQWLLSEDSLEPVGIELTSRRGLVKLFSKSPPPGVFQIAYHRQSILSKFPINLCSFPKIVIVDFAHNSLRVIGEMGCLVYLDTLQLSWNKISYIHNDSLRGLKFLRVLDLSNNLITEIASWSFNAGLPRLFSINLENNRLRTVSISNIILNRPICKLNYKNNRIVQIGGQISFHREDYPRSEVCGLIDLSDNMMQSLPKFTRVQFPQNVSLFHMLQFKLSMSGNEISCDCNLYEYIQEARPWLEQHWLEYTTMKCSGPLHLQQTQISQISKNDQIDSLVCNISRQDGCPSPCSCYTQPSRYRTIINCTSFNLTSIPLHHVMSDHKVVGLFNRHSAKFENFRYFISMSCYSSYAVLLIIGVCAIALILFIIFCIKCVYKHDIYLLSQRLKFPRQNYNNYEYDAYVCFCESNSDVIAWSRDVLLPYLEGYGYSIFFPPRDEGCGAFKEEEIIVKMTQCRNYLFVLTEDFLVDNENEFSLWCRLMWKHAWENFKLRGDILNIIIVNYDFIRWKSVENNILRAYLRQRLAIDFSDKTHGVLIKIRKRMGLPTLSVTPISTVTSSHILY